MNAQRRFTMIGLPPADREAYIGVSGLILPTPGGWKAKWALPLRQSLRYAV